ncbi:alpha/beta fold hydrolase [Myxacorys almedinensis]|uniref:Alpha/beta fold hydrolase n=1 Tax=Myxacorys almedinensis A TaxID=2690445 RepID=A0A8J7ZAA4_9CYAN|nr:alpha/beta hydrolase [Myxacorys almedinensis]NDJ18300.1 alpha/beta fold hydrolase [Myxacorys almedinensis A]
MLQFQPPGFGQKTVQTSLGAIAYYTPVDAPWTPDASLPPLVFLHSFGGGASAYEWSKVYPAFASTHRVIAPDLLGWGDSDHPVRQYRNDDYLLTLAELIQQVSEAPVTLVAASLTGAIAVRLAVAQPHLVRSLFLSCPSGFADFGQAAGRRIPLQIIGLPLLDRLIYTLGATSDLAVRNFLEQFLFTKRDYPTGELQSRITNEMVSAYLESARRPNAEYSALAFLRGDLYFDLSMYLPQLAIPTAIVWGKTAQFTSVELGRRLAALNPQAIQSFQEIPDAGVLSQLEQPSVVTGLLAKWLHASPPIN